ncbi:hypothetical protein TMatcc_006072 [Talaromyces marneffei ATCC 18224]
MHLLFIIITAISVLSSLASADDRIVILNNCEFAIYIWTTRSREGQNIAVQPNSQWAGTRYQVAGGVDIKVTTSPDGILTAAPRYTFTYDWVGDVIWYGVNDLFGDPFGSHRVVVVPVNATGPACHEINWPAGFPVRGRTKARGCGPATDLHVNLCGLPVPPPP